MPLAPGRAGPHAGAVFHSRLSGLAPLVLLLVLPLVAAAQAPGRPPAKGHPLAFAATDGGVAGTPGAGYLASLPRAAQDALTKDGVVVLDQASTGSGPSLIKAAVRFKRPIAEAYAIIAQPSRHRLYLPHVVQSDTFGERTAEGELVDYKVVWLFTFEHRTQLWNYPEEHRVEWSLAPKPGDALKEQEGYWQLYQLDEHTTVGEYATRIVTRGAVLNFLRSLGERGAVKDSLVALKKYTESATTDPPAAPPPH
jgi:hypothetical protein